MPDPNPIDTIRGIVADCQDVLSLPDVDRAMAALTEVEHQLAGERLVLHEDWRERCEAAEAALAEKDTECADWYGKALAAQHDQERAEAALAEANERMKVMSRVGVREVDARKAAERRANDYETRLTAKVVADGNELHRLRAKRDALADALHQIKNMAEAAGPGEIPARVIANHARAALDRHTKGEA